MDGKRFSGGFVPRFNRFSVRTRGLGKSKNFLENRKGLGKNVILALPPTYYPAEHVQIGRSPHASDVLLLRSRMTSENLPTLPPHKHSDGLCIPVRVMNT